MNYVRNTVFEEEFPPLQEGFFPFSEIRTDSYSLPRNTSSGNAQNIRRRNRQRELFLD